VRHVPAQSRHDSGVCACLVESGLYLSILVYLLDLVFIFSPSASLVFISFISPCSCCYFLVAFSLLVFYFSLFGHVPSRSACPALRVGLAALCLLPVWFRGDVLCRMGRRRCDWSM